MTFEDCSGHHCKFNRHVYQAYMVNAEALSKYILESVSTLRTAIGNSSHSLTV